MLHNYNLYNILSKLARKDNNWWLRKSHCRTEVHRALASVSLRNLSVSSCEIIKASLHCAILRSRQLLGLNTRMPVTRLALPVYTTPSSCCQVLRVVAKSNESVLIKQKRWYALWQQRYVRKLKKTHHKKNTGSIHNCPHDTGELLSNTSQWCERGASCCHVIVRIVVGRAGEWK